ncbi:hypothetical protein K2173_024403 [Erythroxylum novogranatense]|uniref:Late embryogenesis abundant protein n=1 Tax=Erythroxylum novogranatense TaxID=1862640 RepID=A0AAV8SUZ2_9ROSI|nr:hypothetical protein K2173_024403 [Erythroxylum novogranatense]
MSKLLRKTFPLLSTRLQVNATEKLSNQKVVATSVVNKTKDMAENRKEIFWMRDPKTGNWVPENHFDDIDVADLRNQLLSKKH